MSLLTRLVQLALPRATALDLRLIAFSALLYLCSGVGQTYFIQFYREDIAQALSISDGTFGSFYFFGTLASGLLIFMTGRIFDVWDLRRVTILVVVGAGISCMFFGQIWFLFMLAPAIFLQRHTGQGLMSHVANSTPARYFTHLRGRATSVVNASYALGEASLPALGALLVMLLGGWQMMFTALGFILILIVLPLALWLLRGHDQRQALYLQRLEDENAADDANPVPGSRRRQWTLGEVVRDPTIYMLVPTIMAPSFIFTGLVIYGLEFAKEFKLEPQQWLFAWSIYAILQFCFTFPIGWLVDRLTATRLAAFVAIPLALGLLVSFPFTGIGAALSMLLFIGMGQALGSILVGPMLAEIYGVKHMGKIKSLFTSLTVVASAGGPLLVGNLLDVGIDLKTQSLGFAAYIFLAAIVAFIATSRLNVRPLAAPS